MHPNLSTHFSHLFTCFFLSLLWISPCKAVQLQIQFPFSRMVFQRDQANRSTFTVSGLCPTATDRVEFRLTPLQPGQGVAIDWQLLDASATQGRFKGAVNATGGWYQLDVRTIYQGSVVAMTTLDRVGVGEVFLLSGQSNARGLLGLGAVGAADDRVNCINYNNTTNDTTQLPLPPVFLPMAAETYISPKGESAWCWGRLGDLLASRFNVPILFYNVASAGTLVRNWRESAEGKTTFYTFGDALPPGMPYNQFKRVLIDYVGQTGVRAVLWHQGEAEAYDTPSGQPLAYPTNYTADLNWLIERSRQETGLNLSWMVARVSIDNNIAGIVGSNHYQPVIDAQNQTIQITPNVFPGPDTDVIQFPRTAKGAGVHFTDDGLIDLANAWNTSLNDAFFVASTPILPPNPQLIDLQLSVRTNKRVTPTNQPVSFSVIVANTSAYPATQVQISNTLPPNLTFVNSTYFTNAAGTLSANIPTLGAGQSAVLTYQAVPTAPGIYQNAAEISYCDQIDSDSHPNSDVADGEDDEGWADLRTTEFSTDLFRTPVRPSTPPAPAPLSSQPTPNPSLADLSLRLVASTLAPSTGQPLSLTIVIENGGGANAQNVQVGCLLPGNLTFLSSPNMGASSGLLRGSIAFIPAGGTGLLWFTATPTAAGMALTMAQIEAATPGDPDSTPNNGFTNGEDDTAQCLIRVR